MTFLALGPNNKKQIMKDMEVGFSKETGKPFNDLNKGRSDRSAALQGTDLPTVQRCMCKPNELDGVTQGMLRALYVLC